MKTCVFLQFVIALFGHVLADYYYDMNITSFVLVEADDDCLDFHDLVAYKYEGIETFFFNFTLMRNLSTDSMMELSVSVWNGNKYDRTPFSVKRNICDYFKYDYKYLKAGFANSNIPTSCPVKKGYYYVDKMIVPKGTFFPVPLSSERIQFSTKLFHVRKLCFSGIFYMSIKKVL